MSVVPIPSAPTMLWESVDASVALAERFGFADAGAATSWIGDAVWDRWSLAARTWDRLIISAGNLLAWLTTEDGAQLIAKVSVCQGLFARLADTAALRMWLQGRGVPVAAPVAAVDGRLQIEIHELSVGLTPVVAGGLLDVGDPSQVQEAGGVFAALHEALAAYPHPVDGGRPAAGEQLVHNDFRSANLLHDGTRLTAVLDFEDVAYTSRVADLARAAVLLGTRYRDWAPTAPAVRAAFVEAYDTRSPLTNDERGQLQNRIHAVLAQFGWDEP